MARYFKSDNTAPAAPEIIEAIAAANHGYARGYGDDAWSSGLEARFSALFEKSVRVFPVSTGTAANTLSLATLVPPYGAILTHEEGHIVRDECGAPEFMTGGARLLLMQGPNAKVTPQMIDRTLAANPTSVHTVQPRALSITQATELGTVYTPREVKALSDVAHSRGLSVHMDGARFANAVASLGCSPADITWRAGIDVLSFGATKNGALTAEAVIFFDPARAGDFEFRRKRAGHLLSKMRFVSAQLLAYLDNDLWLRLATRANSLAARLGQSAGSTLMHPVEANEVFVRIGESGAAALREQGFEFYDWGAVGSGEARLVVSWDQPEEDVTALCAALAALESRGRAQ
ncbi:MAG: threonine aldolase family protein [Gammaproteobacteria bacterium]